MCEWVSAGGVSPYGFQKGGTQEQVNIRGFHISFIYESLEGTHMGLIN